CSSLELQNHKNQKLSKIERYLNFLKFKEKCQVYENGCLKINIYVVEGNGGQMREDHNSIPNGRVAIIDDRISNFVFKSIMNGVEIPDFVDKIYNLIIGAVVSKNGKCSFFEYENDFYFVNKDVYRIENKNRLVVYKNEIEIDSFE
ncbi:hypothetical protein EQH57_0601, partial [Dictyocoela roeselum]